jgi:hypothetical protein
LCCGVEPVMIIRCAINQAECIENTQPLPQRNQHFYFAKAFGWKKPFEGGAGTVPLRRRGERSLKPSIFFLICVLLSGHKSVGVAKGVCPLGRRAGVKVLPEKGRQRAVSGVRRASEGGKRSCSPSEELVGEKDACF